MSEKQLFTPPIFFLFFLQCGLISAAAYKHRTKNRANRTADLLYNETNVKQHHINGSSSDEEGLDIPLLACAISFIVVLLCIVCVSIWLYRRRNNAKVYDEENPPTVTEVDNQKMDIQVYDEENPPPVKEFNQQNNGKVYIEKNPPQVKGFPNLGNTCFMNAVLQCLFSIQPFAQDLLSLKIPLDSPETTFIKSIVTLLATKDTCSKKEKEKLLREVLSGVSAKVNRFKGYRQQDAHDFLIECQNLLKQKITERLIQNEKMICPVSCNFDFELEHLITCKACDNAFSCEEQTSDLSIEIPKVKNESLCSLQDSLDCYFKMEEIEYTCSVCGAKRANMQHKFSSLPRVLTLHLKRFYFTKKGSVKKLNNSVTVPETLTVMSYCTDRTAISSARLNSTINETPKIEAKKAENPQKKKLKPRDQNKMCLMGCKRMQRKIHEYDIVKKYLYGSSLQLYYSVTFIICLCIETIHEQNENFGDMLDPVPQDHLIQHCAIII